MKTLLVFGFIFATFKAHSASTTANVTSYVVRAINIEKISDLNFGIGIPGDSSKVVLPGTVENDENASFKISGEPGAVFNISLPMSSGIVINNGAGGSAQTEIKITNFKTNVDNTFPKFNEQGQFKLFVGATRASIRQDQIPGPYVGFFPVVVVY